MPKARRTSDNLALKLKIVAKAKAVENNSEITRECGISDSMVRRWRKDQANLFNCEIKLSAKRNGLQSREAKVSFLLSIDFVF